MCGGPQVHSEIKITLLIFKHTPNSKSSLRILITHSEIQNYTPVSKSSLRIRKLHSEFKNITPNSKTSLPIWKHYSEFANITPNLKTPLLIPKLHYEFENITLNWKTWLQIRKLHSQFSNSTPSSKTSLPIPNRRPRVLRLFFQRVEPEGGTKFLLKCNTGYFSKFSRWRWQTHPASSGFSWPDVTLRWERNHCDQPFAFPSSMRVHVMTTNIQRQDGNENFNKTIGLITKTTTFHLCTRIWVRAMIGLGKSHCQFSNQVKGKFETHFR